MIMSDVCKQAVMIVLCTVDSTPMSLAVMNDIRYTIRSSASSSSMPNVSNSSFRLDVDLVSTTVIVVSSGSSDGSDVGSSGNDGIDDAMTCSYIFMMLFRVQYQ